MYAVLVQVDIDDAASEAARAHLNQNVIPTVRERGDAKAGYWLEPADGHGLAILVFDTEEAARGFTGQIQVGQKPAPTAPDGVTVRSVDVREVIASI
jgi:hypothetical protein